jgi:DHA1 family bicyclomycin/chloramphenicol resistance-like MFS transporter
MGCLLAPGISELSAFRVMQGVGAAAGVVVARAVLRDVYGPTGLTKAISSMFLIMVWVPITAPLMGGIMSSLFDWRVSFLVMASIAGATLVGSIVWLSETNPAVVQSALPEHDRWTDILANPTFLRHALANMFCIATMLLFLSNYSYITEALYGFSARQNGYVLTGFNAVISAGVYLVRLSAPRIGVEKSIQLGLWMTTAGWALLWIVSLLAEQTLTLMLPCVALACLGMGMVMTLTVGQALISFTYAAGTASALFIFVQSTGASLINFLVSTRYEVTLLHITSVLAICSLLALAVSKGIGRD